MASGGSGSGFNPFRKKGLLTPKLLRKRESKSEDREKETETTERDPEPPLTADLHGASTSLGNRNDCPPSAPSHSVSSLAEGSVIAMFPCERPRCSVHCHMNSLRTVNRMSFSGSTKHLGPGPAAGVGAAGENKSKRKSKTLTLRRKKSEQKTNSKQSKFWTFRIKKRLPMGLRRKENKFPADPTPLVDAPSCVCTSYKRTELPDQQQAPPSNSRRFAAAQAAPGLIGASASPMQPNSNRTTRLALGAGPGPTGVRRLNPQLFQLVPAPSQAVGATFDLGAGPGRAPPGEDYPTEDIDEMMIAQRARDMELGIEISPSHLAYPHLHYSSSVSSSSSSSGSSTLSEHAVNSLNMAFQNQCVVTTTTTLYPGASPDPVAGSRDSYRSCESEYGEFGALSAPSPASYIPRTVHTQVDYIHCLVPDLVQITKCSFYWGVIDRYEAERLLEHRPEGTFLLRDSAQEEFLFSVSFRRYGRSLHARIEQWNHKFSFDSHDPGVFASDTVCGLIEHYKDPSCCMFFEPMLTNPLNRTFPFSLQHLCRTVICNNTTYDGLNFLPLPKSVRDYLKYYHYKQKVRVRRFEVNN